MKFLLYGLIICSLFTCLGENRLFEKKDHGLSLGELGKTVPLKKDLEGEMQHLEFFFDQQRSQVGLYLWRDSLTISDSLIIEGAASSAEGSFVSDYFKLLVPVMGGSGTYVEKTFLLSVVDDRIIESLNIVSSYLVSIGDVKENYRSELYEVKNNECIVLSTLDGVSRYDTLNFSNTSKVFYNDQVSDTGGNIIYVIDTGRYRYKYDRAHWTLDVGD